jgi:5-methylcytosine-specific restriction endonuclease McrA
LVKQNEDYKNRAKRNEKEVRKIGDTVKRKIVTTMHCPYCTTLMNDGGHVDHIYPISKGGHSVETNMVKVCGDCNLKKGSLTLREFIAKYKLDRDAIERRLDELGKKF